MRTKINVCVCVCVCYNMLQRDNRKQDIRFAPRLSLLVIVKIDIAIVGWCRCRFDTAAPVTVTDVVVALLGITTHCGK